jgi:DNA-binding LytR/AlgR family response regulator
MTLQCLIVDDDDLSRETLRHYASKSSLHVVGVYEDPVTASTMLREIEDLDLLFLDVEMEPMSGVEMLTWLAEDKLIAMPKVVMVTSHEEYALDAFEHNVVDFLTKPVSYPRFLKAVGRVQNQIRTERLAEDARDAEASTPPSNAVAEEAPSTSPPQQETTSPPEASDVQNERGSEPFFVKEGRRMIRIEVEAIRWIEAQGDYVLVETEDDRYTVRTTMKKMVERLPDDSFQRVHRSYIVRLHNIKDIEDSTILVGGKIIPIGTTYEDDFFESIELI